MKKTVFELRKNQRAQALREKNAAPGEVSTPENIKVVVKAKDSFYESVAIKKRDNLVQDILNRKQYHQMTPLSIITGVFEIEPGCMETFRELADSHGLAVQEMIEV